MRFNLYRVLENALTSLDFDYVDSITKEKEVSEFNKVLLFELFNDSIYRHDVEFKEGLLFLDVYGNTEQEVSKTFRDIEKLLLFKKFADEKIRVFHIEKNSSSLIVWDDEVSKFMGYISLLVRWENL